MFQKRAHQSEVHWVSTGERYPAVGSSKTSTHPIGQFQPILKKIKPLRTLRGLDETRCLIPRLPEAALKGCLLALWEFPHGVRQCNHGHTPHQRLLWRKVAKYIGCKSSFSNEWRVQVVKMFSQLGAAWLLSYPIAGALTLSFGVPATPPENASKQLLTAPVAVS